MHEIILSGYGAYLHKNVGKRLLLGTADSYGIERLHLTRGPGWEDLIIKATFHSPPGKTVNMLVSEDDCVDVPREATADVAKDATTGIIVFSGTAKGVQLISADLPYTVIPHAGVEGEEPSSPTESEWEQLAVAYQSKLDKQQGAENAGKVLGIGEDGMVKPVKQTGGGGAGNNGATFTPSVSEDGVLSWTNDGDLPNPEPVNIKGTPGKPGDNYVLTEADKQEIAEQAAQLVEVPEVEIPDIPTALPNPHALTFTGAVTGSYDGSAPMEIEIPEGGAGGGEWEPLVDITLEEDSAISRIEHDFSYKKMYGILILPKVENPISTQGLFSFVHQYSLYYQTIGNKSYPHRVELLVERVASNILREEFMNTAMNGVGFYTGLQTRGTSLTTDGAWGTKIDRFQTGGTLVLPAGTILKVWGQR